MLRLVLSSQSRTILSCILNSFPIQFLPFRLISKITYQPTLRSASTAFAHSFSDTDQLPNSSTCCNTEPHINTFHVIQKLKGLHNNPSLALSFFTELKQRGFSHNTSTYAAMIKILCYWGLDRRLDSMFLDIIHVYKQDPSSFEIKVHDLFEELLKGGGDDGGVKGNQNHYLLKAFDVFVKACASLDMFDEAVDFLFQTSRRGILPNVFACNFLINQMVENGEVDMALSIYKHFKRLGLSPNHYTYAIVIKALCKKGDFEYAGSVFEEMEGAGVTPNSYCYAAFIEGLCNNHSSDVGYEVLQACRKSNAPIEVYAYIAVIRGFCNEMKLDKAEAVFFDMKSQGLVPNVYIYSAMIHGYCKSHHLHEALVLHDEMISRGIKTNCMIVSCILHCLGEMGMTSDVVDLFRKFKESGMFLNGVAYNIVFDALCKLGKVDDAIVMLEELKDKHIDLDIKHYTTFINGYCLQGKLAEADCMFKEMKNNGFKPDIVTYNVLAAGLSRNGHSCKPLLDYMEKQGVKPNSTTHKIIIRGLCSGGNIEEAEQYFDSLEDKSVEIYSAMVNCYCEVDLVENSYKLSEAVSLLDTMLKMNMEPRKVMYSKMFAALCREGNMKEARSLFDSFIGGGFTPDVVTYTIMINSYCRMNCLQKAHELFQDMMKRTEIKPDIITYTVLLDGSLKHANFEGNFSCGKLKAATIWRDMKEMKISPDVVTYTVLIDGHIKADNFQDAITLFDEMIDRGLEPDAVTYTSLISSFYKRGHKDKAIELFNEMSSKGMTPGPALKHCILKARKVQFRKGEVQSNVLLTNLLRLTTETLLFNYFTKRLCLIFIPQIPKRREMQIDYQDVIVSSYLETMQENILYQTQQQKYLPANLAITCLGYLVLHQIVYSANVYLLRRFKINYAFIFAFDEGTELGYREVFLLSSGLAVLSLVAVLSNLDMEMDQRTKYSLTFTGFVPLVIVNIPDNFLADQLTSQLYKFTLYRVQGLQKFRILDLPLFLGKLQDQIKQVQRK